MDTIIRLAHAERGFLMLRDESNELSIRVARNWEHESLESSEFRISRTVINRVITEGQPVLTTDAQEDPRFTGQQSIAAYNLRSILCAPLKVKGELTGVIYADNRIRSGIFTQKTLELLSAFSNQAAVAIENARLFTSIRQTLAEVTELINLMDNVFSSIASGVITADLEQQILLCNQAAEVILGSSAKDLVGNRLGDALPALACILVPYQDQVCKSNQAIVGLEYTANLPQRGQIDLRFNLSPLKDAQQETQGVAIVLEDLTEKKQLEAQRRLFERMVSPAVIEQLDPNKLHLGGQCCEITILFADIRGFTSLAEWIPPETLVSVLNQYLAAAADAILAEGGTIDKFVGDAVMAWFNAPIAQEDHTLRALRAALEIRNAVEKLHLSLLPEFHLWYGIGIHFGEAILGLVGTERRLDYTAIGDSVNTAKRLQENAIANQVLISQQVYQRVGDQIIAKSVEPVIAKGKRDPLVVYELLQIK